MPIVDELIPIGAGVYLGQMPLGASGPIREIEYWLACFRNIVQHQYHVLIVTISIT